MQPNHQPILFLSIDEAARAIGVSRRGIYRLLDSGQLPSRKIGKLRRIPLAALERMAAETTVGDAS